MLPARANSSGCEKTEQSFPCPLEITCKRASPFPTDAARCWRRGVQISEALVRTLSSPREQRGDFLPPLLIHPDERRPGAFEAFAGEFLRRVNAEFIAAGDFAGGMFEHVERTFGGEAVALRISAGYSVFSAGAASGAGGGGAAGVTGAGAVIVVVTGASCQWPCSTDQTFPAGTSPGG